MFTGCMHTNLLALHAQLLIQQHAWVALRIVQPCWTNCTILLREAVLVPACSGVAVMA